MFSTRKWPLYIVVHARRVPAVCRFFVFCRSGYDKTEDKTKKNIRHDINSYKVVERVFLFNLRTDFNFFFLALHKREVHYAAWTVKADRHVKYIYMSVILFLWLAPYRAREKHVKCITPTPSSLVYQNKFSKKKNNLAFSESRSLELFLTIGDWFSGIISREHGYCRDK